MLVSPPSSRMLQGAVIPVIGAALSVLLACAASPVASAIPTVPEEETQPVFVAPSSDPPIVLRSSEPPVLTLPSAKVVPEEAEAMPAAPAHEEVLPWSPGVPMHVDVDGDRPVLVYMAAPHVEHAIIYLHGHCGRLAKIDGWASEATRFGTVIALLGNWECNGAPGRFRWGMSVRYLNDRIVRAAERVKELRGGALDADHVTLIGYSQGAEKAQLLPRWYPERYPRIVLAGPPMAPHPWLLAPARAVVVIAGENENQEHMRRGFRDLQFAGQLAAFMELPAAAHGDFGSEGAVVMGQALWWLFDRAP
jgi:pimeloyl-ACP methyl ester carboxylesterase